MKICIDCGKPHRHGTRGGLYADRSSLNEKCQNCGRIITPQVKRNYGGFCPQCWEAEHRP